MLSFSTGLKNGLLDSEALRDLLDDGFIKVYSGTIPASADAALGSAVELITYSENNAGEGVGQGFHFEANAVSGAISKDTGQVWSGTSSATATADGPATFYRYVLNADAGGALPTAIRIQGTVGGAGADLFVQSTVYSDSTLYTIDYYSVSIPL